MAYKFVEGIDRSEHEQSEWTPLLRQLVGSTVTVEWATYDMAIQTNLAGKLSESSLTHRSKDSVWRDGAYVKDEDGEQVYDIEYNPVFVVSLPNNGGTAVFTPAKVTDVALSGIVKLAR